MRHILNYVDGFLGMFLLLLIIKIVSTDVISLPPSFPALIVGMEPGVIAISFDCSKHKKITDGNTDNIEPLNQCQQKQDTDSL